MIDEITKLGIPAGRKRKMNLTDDTKQKFENREGLASRVMALIRLASFLAPSDLFISIFDNLNDTQLQ